MEFLLAELIRRPPDQEHIEEEIHGSLQDRKVVNIFQKLFHELDLILQAYRSIITQNPSDANTKAGFT